MTERKHYRTRNGRTPAARIKFVKAYVRADHGERRRMLARASIPNQSASQWAQFYFGCGLRELRRRIGLPAQ